MTTPTIPLTLTVRTRPTIARQSCLEVVAG